MYISARKRLFSFCDDETFDLSPVICSKVSHGHTRCIYAYFLK